MSEDLLHYGIKRRSGRYPWGSGDDPQRSRDIVSIMDDMKSKGMSEKEIAGTLGISTTILRQEVSIAKVRRREAMMDTIDSMTKRGETNVAIAERLGVTEKTIRDMKKKAPEIHERREEKIKKVLSEAIDEHGYLDVGRGIERQLGISREKLNAIVREMQQDGEFTRHKLHIKRLQDNTKDLTVLVLTKDPDLASTLSNADKIRTLEKYSEDNGNTIRGLKPIVPYNPDKVQVVFGEQGGTDKDGLIELRRGVDDLDLGSSRYAQVRIQVGDGHFLKGMAVYADDLPDGVDIRFNTNKPETVGKLGALKKVKADESNPFGSSINRQNGALNVVNEEGDWTEWKATLASQFLSKQPTSLVKERLGKTYDSILKDFDEIKSLTNPTVKKYLMDEYVNSLDTKYTKLKAQGIKGTRSHVILPFTDMKPNEVYAPNYKNGDNVVLIRYPHGGIFELAELRVNNKSRSAKNIIQNAIDAIGIHPSVAQKLSGADFDGDSVLVVPNNSGKIKTSKALKELKDFDPISSYQVDYQTITEGAKNRNMGIVSNLITDMTIKGASPSELARAVKHSMVVIDSEKHRLDYKQSEVDNGIAALQRKYQTHIDVDGKRRKGASTLISKKLQGTVHVDYEEIKVKNPTTGRMNTIKVGGKKVRLIDTVDDAHLLSSGSAVENVYAGYINKVRGVQNTATKYAETIPKLKWDREQSKVYVKEVKSLDKKLNTALLNEPRERQAQLLANKNFYSMNLKEMSADEIKKAKTQVVKAAREVTNANGRETMINVTPSEWKAIQSGAISNDKLTKILKYADSDQLKQYALPKNKASLSTASQGRARSMFNSGYTYAEIAQQLGVSPSTISSLIND